MHPIEQLAATATMTLFYLPDLGIKVSKGVHPQYGPVVLIGEHVTIHMRMIPVMPVPGAPTEPVYCVAIVDDDTEEDEEPYGTFRQIHAAVHHAITLETSYVINDALLKACDDLQAKELRDQNLLN